MAKLQEHDFQFLLQFVKNADQAGVLWKVGECAEGGFIVHALVGVTPVQGKQPKLIDAIKECVSNAAKLAALPSLLGG